MFQKKLNLALAILLIMVSCVVTYFIDEDIHHRNLNNKTLSLSNPETSIGTSNLKTDRLGGYRLIKPIIDSEQEQESSKYSDLKIMLITYIELLKNEQNLQSASIFLRDFENGDWMCINDSETYFPGSLLKLPGLITYLKMAETNPSLLDKKLILGNPHQTIPNQTFNSKQIEAGKPYTIRQLLKYMISYSDNNATYLLNKNANLAAFHQLFSDLHIPKFSKSNTTITAKNFSRFLSVIFNASYLNKENSEFAAELLEECDFRFGMVKGLPVNTVVAHKFGEMGDSTTRQLHESGLIYINNMPYLLTIMTKGYTIKNLPEIISTMTKLVYQDLINKQSY